jgi:chromosome segregation ATPase
MLPAPDSCNVENPSVSDCAPGRSDVSSDGEAAPDRSDGEDSPELSTNRDKLSLALSTLVGTKLYEIVQLLIDKLQTELSTNRGELSLELFTLVGAKLYEIVQLLIGEVKNTKVDNLQALVDELQAENAMRKRDLDTVQKENCALKDGINMHRKSFQNYQRNILGLNARHNYTLSKANNQIAILQNDLITQRNTLQAESKTQCSALQVENGRLQSDLITQRDTLWAEIGRLRAEIGRLRGENGRLQFQSEARRVELITQRDRVWAEFETQLTALRVESETQRNTLQVEFETQRNTLQVESDRLQSESETQLAAQRSEFETHLTKLQAELTKTQQELANGVSLELTQVSASFTKSKSENLELKKRIRYLEAELVTVKAASKQSASKQSTSKQSAKPKKQTTKSAPDPLLELADDIKNLQTASGELLQLNATMRAERDALRREIVTSQAVLKTLKDSEVEFKKREVELKRREENIQEGERDLAEARKIVGQQTMTYQLGYDAAELELSEKVDKVRENFDAIVTDSYHKGLKAGREERDKVVETLKTDCEFLQGQMSMLFGPQSEEIRSISHLEEITKLKAEIDRLRSGNSNEINAYRETIKMQGLRMKGCGSFHEFMSYRIRTTSETTANSREALGKLCEYLMSLSGLDGCIQTIVTGILLRMTTIESKIELIELKLNSMSTPPDYDCIDLLFKAILDSDSEPANQMVQQQFGILRKKVAANPIRNFEFSERTICDRLRNILEFFMLAGLCGTVKMRR